MSKSRQGAKRYWKVYWYGFVRDIPRRKLKRNHVEYGYLTYHSGYGTYSKYMRQDARTNLRHELVKQLGGDWDNISVATYNRYSNIWNYV